MAINIILKEPLIIFKLVLKQICAVTSNGILGKICERIFQNFQAKVWKASLEKIFAEHIKKFLETVIKTFCKECCEGILRKIKKKMLEESLKQFANNFLKTFLA